MNACTRFSQEDMDGCCDNELNLSKLCVKCIRAHWIKTKKVIAEEMLANHFCAQEIDAKMLKAENAVINDACIVNLKANMAQIPDLVVNTQCAQFIKSHKVWANALASNDLCAQEGNIKNLCVDQLRVNNMLDCNKLVAYAGYTANAAYVLGTNIVFDTIFDDPNGNASIVPFFSYTVPVAGYYQFDFQLSITDLTGAAVIVGIPISSPDVLVNGVIRSSTQSSFLSFLPAQKLGHSGMLRLAMGDVVTLRYRVHVLDPISGFMDYVGSVVQNGVPVDSGHATTFKIAYVTSLCEGGELPPCEPCPPVEILCEPITIQCAPVTTPCDPVECGNCDPCNSCCNR